MKYPNNESNSYYPALDGLRGWMALGVVVAHVNLAWFPGAMIMMESFFVISGFLITTIIWRFTEKTGEFNLVNFWKRRLMRLYPVLILVIFTSSTANVKTGHLKTELSKTVLTP